MIDFKLFQRPQRYIGNEYNVIKKPHNGKIRICVGYPDSYELGMSNLGLRIIYGMLNDFPDVVCERVFLPGSDLTQFLEKNSIKLFSLETKTNLDEFDVVGFNLDYELNFTNFLHILQLGAIPLNSLERKETIVIVGGISNPEPIAQFVDVFYLGEFEVAADKFIEVLRQFKDKESRLRALSEIDGFYVPRFYRASLNGNRYDFEPAYSYAKFPVKRVFVKNLDAAYYPRKWLTPHTEIVHDRVPIEIARGCPNRCFFCQAQALYYPYRERKASAVTALVKDIYQGSGYENFSLLALSASDYSQIEGLIDEFLDSFKNEKVGLSLPSLRIDDIVGRLYNKIIPFKKTSLTLALEAATDTLREKMNKKVSVNKLFEAAHAIRALKLKHIKIYFMFGFPQESEEDLIGIGKFLGRLSYEARIAINTSINIFCPKPFSVWQNVAMDSQETLAKKQQLILESMPRTRSVNVSISQPRRSLLEAILSRADRRFCGVIYRAFLKGARYDGYGESFSWKIWEEAMKEEGVDYRFYLEAKTENFPWSFIQTDQRPKTKD